MKLRLATLCAVAWIAGSGPVGAQPVNVIFSNLAGANNNVPDIGRVFNPGTTGTSAFDRPFLSPDGTRWIIGAVGDDATDDKELVITGFGTTTVGATTVAVEDSPTAFDGAISWTLFRTRMGINNAGQFAFSGDTTAATTADDVVVRFDGVSQSAVVREGNPSPVGGQNHGATNDSAHILNDGTVRYRSVLAPTTTQQILGSGATSLGQTDVLIPGNQLVGPAQSVDNFAAERFTSSADGSSHIWRGDLNGPTTTDDVIVVNGNVVAQEGAPLPGGLLPGLNVAVISGDAGSQQMSPNGQHWLARVAMNDGTGVTATDVVLHNGNIIAQTDTPIFAGDPLLWDDTNFGNTFFMGLSNDLGDRVVGGLVNTGDLNNDGVLVYLGADGRNFILVREGDPIDLNGNGLNDDNAFIDLFGNDDAVLTNDGRFYFVATIQDGANTTIGQGFMWVQVAAVPEPGTVALVGLAAAGGWLSAKRWVRRRRSRRAR